jgi:hypothetical protein
MSVYKDAFLCVVGILRDHTASGVTPKVTLLWHPKTPRVGVTSVWAAHEPAARAVHCSFVAAFVHLQEILERRGGFLRNGSVQDPLWDVGEDYDGNGASQ